MYQITVNGTFAGAHNLVGYKGKCEELHGHNWKVEVTLAGKTLNKLGMLYDFVDLKKLLKDSMEKLDHKYLNKIMPFNRINPSSENIAKYIFDDICKKVKSKEIRLKSVTVWESENQRACYDGASS